VRSFENVRVLIVGWKPNTNPFLRDVLRSLTLPAFTRVVRTCDALTSLRDHGYEMVLCTADCEPLEPAVFVNAVRRDQLSRDPTIPIVIVTTGSTRAEIESMRDAGADYVLVPPMSTTAVKRILEKILLEWRNFVIGKSYIGPDRRRGAPRDFMGENKRVTEVLTFVQPPRAKLGSGDPPDRPTKGSGYG
jgi:two-component system chemotaxis response regulator CheY